jgi:SpoVK/Ycf46/Vps4 family AAA+-type ATPase
LALQGDQRQTEAFVRRLARQQKKDRPELAGELISLIEAAPSNSVLNATRRAVRPERASTTEPAGAAAFVPVDGETRLELLRTEYPDQLLEEPVFLPTLRGRLDQIITERQRLPALLQAGLDPSRTILFTGPPGVGKTLTAKWIARELRQPILTLDLATVMSSFLGRTGANLRAVLDYAKRADGVLFLDEFDAVAKRRGDDTEVGELKRLVTVLLQEIDHWPADRLLIAATNHGELLDPAVWRRFDVIVDFPLPTPDSLTELAEKELEGLVGANWAKALAAAMVGHSFSDLVRLIKGLRRQAVILDVPVEERLLAAIQAATADKPKAAIKTIALELEAAGVPQRQISDIFGLSRDTIRKARLEREIRNG